MTRIASALAFFLVLLVAVPPAGAKAVSVPPLGYTERTLANGLRVYTMRDTGTANVAVHVWYDVGSRDDPPGRSGFAHLFEHMMFKATRNVPPETFDRLTEDVGGFNNASTADDYTNYYAVVPANHLERILWAEAERMGSLVVDQAVFASERDVVKEEFRQRILASPYGRLFGLYLVQTFYDKHPYGRPGIGSIEDLDAATIDDVRAFHATYYRPDNAILVISGNFDPAQADRWIDAYFGPLATPKRPIPRVTVAEPNRTAPKDVTAYAPNVPLAAVTLSFPGLDSKSPDIAALTVLDGILSSGESSRLYESLVYRQQVANEAGTTWDAPRGPGMFTAYAILAAGKSPDEGIAALSAELARLRDTPVTAAELDEAKNELLVQKIGERETANGRAFELANSVLTYGDGRASSRILNEIQAVTAADVQRVARTIFDDKARVAIRYLAEDAKDKGRPGDTIVSAPGIVATPITLTKAEVPVTVLAPEGERRPIPAAGAAVTAQFPAPAEKTLANGLRVIVASKPGLPLLSADLRVLAGSAADPKGRSGTAAFAADLLTKGTKSRSATDIARAVESLGATLSATAGSDTSSVSLSTRSDRAADAFGIMADVAIRPTFAAEELDRARTMTLDDLSVALKQPGGLASRAMTRLVFGDAPYGGVTTPASVKALTRADIAGFHASQYRPDNAILVIAGDVGEAEGFALAEAAFGAWAKPATPKPARPNSAAAASGTRVIAIDLPKSGQAAVSMGLRGLARADADYFPALVASVVLGGGYSSRLNQEIRIKRGLSYGAGASLSARMAPGPITATAQTRNDAAVQVAELMTAELKRLGAEGLSQDELTARSATLIGGFGRTVETTGGLAGSLTNLAAYGLPLSKLQSYVADVAAVTPAQVKAAASRYFDPAKANLVVAGDAAVFFDALKKTWPQAERIPAASIAFDRPALK
jgi:zinc protease